MPRHIAILTPFLILIMLGLVVWQTDAPYARAAPILQETPSGGPAPTAQETPSAPPPTPIPAQNLSLSDEYCLGCHGQPGQTYELQNGEQLDLYVDPVVHQASVHGEQGYACVQCHADVGEYPHPPFQAADRREVTLKLNAVCQRCHSHQFELAEDDAHAAAQAAGIREAAVCVDCHTAHEVRRLTDPETHELLPETRQWIPERCALCHSAIYEKYHDSVHGSALSAGNPDVPTCIDCHGVHNIEDPTTAHFRLQSPRICADCHTDPHIMDKYGISTNVLDTYVADFHGTTVAIFEKQSPDAEVNKAVCYDCHGVHDISSPSDPETGIEMKSNLLVRCQTCHPDANENFPSSWMSHYVPSAENYRVVYWVNKFYAFFIPAVLGSMGALVVLDASRAAIERRKRRRSASEPSGAIIVETSADASPVTDSTSPDQPAGGSADDESAPTDSNSPTEDSHG